MFAGAALLNTHQSQHACLALTASTLVAAKVLPEATRSAQALKVVVSLCDGSLILRSDSPDAAAHLRATARLATPQPNPSFSPQRLNINRGLARIFSRGLQGNSTGYVAKLQRPELGPCNNPCAYYMHPAVGDAALHLAAVTSSVSSTLASTSRVPVAVQVYSSFQVSCFLLASCMTIELSRQYPFVDLFEDPSQAHLGRAICFRTCGRVRMG